jgi:hypothetical protein
MSENNPFDDSPKPLYSLSVGEYISLTRQIVREELQRKLLASPPQTPPVNDLLTVLETASLLGVTPETVYGYSHRRVLNKKSIKGTRRIFFSRFEVMQKLNEGLTKSDSQLEQEATDFVHLKK